MKVIIVSGSRHCTMKDAIFHYLDKYAKGCDVLVHGAARGVDDLADWWGDDAGIKRQAFPADWNKHGKSAGSKRNIWMLDECVREYGADACTLLAFPGPASIGTHHCVSEAKKRGIHGHVINIKGMQ